MAARVSTGAVIPSQLVQDPAIGCTAKLLFGILNMYSVGGRCEMSLVQIGRMAGVLPNNVPRLVQELEDAGWLEIERGGPGRTSSYKLLHEKK